MPSIVYIGDEVSAAGYRLGGARTVIPDQSTGVASALTQCADAELVLLAASMASHLPPPQLDAALRALAPLTLIVPDLDGMGGVPDIATRLSRQLGLD
jgi:vacuolar-type H+-ATPase subunit F/Vma7